MLREMDSAWAKLRWANGRRDELAALVREIERVDTEWVRCEMDPADATLRYFSARIPPVKAEASLLLGECLYGYRSALDCAVYAISANHPDFADHGACEFPIFLHETRDESRERRQRAGFDPDGRAKIRYLPEAAIRVIGDRHQPYSFHTDSSRHPLWWLHRLRNIDQHRELLLAAAVVRAISVGWQGPPDEDIDSAIQFYSPALEPGKVVLAVAYRRDAVFDASFGAEVWLRESGIPQGPVLPLLSDIERQVEWALADLQPYFDEPRHP